MTKKWASTTTATSLCHTLTSPSTLTQVVSKWEKQNYCVWIKHLVHPNTNICLKVKMSDISKN
jgi:hypothetical protein